MRKRVIAGNWKMNKSVTEADRFMDEVVNQIPASDRVESIVCASFPYLASLVEKARESTIKISAQNMHFEDEGAYTGEVSPAMLNQLGVSHVILGHSERREYFAETDETINQKIHAAFKHHLTPIVCVGETLEQREAHQTKSHVEEQVKKALKGLTAAQVSETIIAYEPIWAIGTGKTASSADANEICAHIRQVVREMTSESVAGKIILQYGGSVNEQNISELLAHSDIDGALVGGASLESHSFLQILEEASK